MKLLDNAVFDVKSFWRTVMILLVITALQMATRGVAYAFLVPLAFVAVTTRRIERVMFWVMASMLVLIGNGFFLPKGPVFYIAQRLLFVFIGFWSLTQISGKRQSPLVSPLLGILPYIAFMTLTAFASWNPLISLLKLFLFTSVFLGYYGMANLAGQSGGFDIRKVRSMMLAISCYLIFGSVAVIPFPGISQLSGREYEAAVLAGQDVMSLFKGMTWHSQTLGPVIAFFFAFLLADLVMNVRRSNALYLALLACCPVLVYKTSSRTGMAALISAFMCVGFCVIQVRGFGARWRSKVKSALMLIFVVAVVLVLAIPSLRDSIARYALKYGDENTRTEDFTVEGAMSSRQGLIDRQLVNFHESPVIGNGFQVDEEIRDMKIDSWKQLLSAPVEKGVWVTAVLEEGGVLGFMLLVGFFVVAGFQMLKRGVYTGFTVMSVMLVSNLAEFTMFAMSAQGGLAWAMVFVGCAFDAARIRGDQAPRFFGQLPPRRFGPPTWRG